MDFTWPWALTGLALVGAVALWALLRPGRRLAVVASLELWQRALSGLASAALRRSRRVTLSWVALLVGALAIVLAMAGPVYRGTLPARHIAVAIYPSAELAGDGIATMRRAAATLLDRLGPNDRVLLVLPTAPAAEAQMQWLSPAEAKDRLSKTAALAAAANDLRLALIEGADHVYRFVPAVMDSPSGGELTAISIPTSVGPLTLDAAAAEETGNGAAQVFVAVRNSSAAQAQAHLACRVSGSSHAILALAVRPQGRAAQVWTLPAGAEISVELLDERGTPTAWASLARRVGGVRKVAMIGPDEPLIRRYVEVDKSLVLVAQTAQADLVIANGQDAPPGKPALVINPPSSPAGYGEGRTMNNVLLSAADLRPGDPLLEHLDLSAVAVRRLTPWTGQGLTPVVSIGGAAVVLRDDSQDDPQARRRVYVSFALDADNTNFGMTDALVVFLADATRYLAPPGTPQYALGRPQIDMTPSGPSIGNLPGLRCAQPALDPLVAAARAPLPDARPSPDTVNLWPLLVALALAMWVTGWALRLK